MKNSVLLWLMLSTFWAATPWADEEEADANQSPFVVNVPLDIGIIVGSMLTVGMPRLLANEFLTPSCGHACDSSNVNFIDRTVIGNHSPTAKTISDMGLVAAVALPFLGDALDVWVSDPADGWGGYGRDALVLGEVAAITSAASNLLNFTFRRPRPMVYDDSIDEETRLSANSALSFPSGHTANAFAMATAYSRLFSQRHPHSPWVIPMYLGTYAMATTVGVMRTESGYHFWSDVTAGAALGVGIGLLVPYLHQRAVAKSTSRSDDTQSVQFLLAPAALPAGGLGATFTAWAL